MMTSALSFSIASSFSHSYILRSLSSSHSSSLLSSDSRSNQFLQFLREGIEKGFQLSFHFGLSQIIVVEHCVDL